MLVLQYCVLENKLSVINGRMKRNVYEDGDNDMEKRGTKIGGPGSRDCLKPGASRQTQ